MQVVLRVSISFLQKKPAKMVSFAMMLLAVESQVSDWCVSIRAMIV